MQGPRLYSQDNNAGPGMNQGPYAPGQPGGQNQRFRAEDQRQNSGMNRPNFQPGNDRGRQGMRQPQPQRQPQAEFGRGLTNAQREKLQNKFNQLDQNHDGVISKQEFANASQKKQAKKNGLRQ
jgi:hypothetical protein